VHGLYVLYIGQISIQVNVENACITIYLFSKCLFQPFQFKFLASKFVTKSDLESKCIHSIMQIRAFHQFMEVLSFNGAKGAFFLAKEGGYSFRGRKGIVVFILHIKNHIFW